MRYASRALSMLFLLAGHGVAAEPGAGGAPPNPPPAAGPKTTSAGPKTAPAASTPTASAPAPPPPSAPPPSTPRSKAGDAPPEQYYVEPGFAAPQPGAPAPPESAAPGDPPPANGTPMPPPAAPPPPPAGIEIYEPPPPGFFPGDPVFEPQPLPEPHHIAPRTSLWVGARLGWFVPFGSAFARGVPVGSYGDVNLKGVPWRDYVSSGPMFEIDLGARLSRNYNVFGLWEHAELGAGRGDPDAQSATGAAPVGKSNSGETDFWGIGIRATSDPDRVGFVTELAVGYRRARAKYDGEQIQFSDAPFEARLGIGADFRLNRVVTLSPMVTIGVGSFGTIDRVQGSTIADHTQADDQLDGHAWATFTVGGSFDVLSSKR